MNTGIWSPSPTIKKVRATSGRSRGPGLEGSSRAGSFQVIVVVPVQEEASAPRELECSGSWIDRHDNWILGFT